MDRPPETDTADILPGAEPIDMREEGLDGALLLHGFGDTPQTLTLLARRLRSSGYSVFAPLLPGHGRNMATFRKSRADEWIDAARNAFIEMRGRHPSVSIVGLSMGGALAVTVAAEVMELSALVLLAPYIEMPRRIRIGAATHWVWGRFVGEINARDPRSVRDPIERERNLAHGTVTGSALYELLRVVRRARASLADVTAPALIVQSREDPRCSPEAAEFALRMIGSREKKLVWTEGAGHVITVDYGRERVFREVESWLDAHSRRGATAAAAAKRLSNAPKPKSGPERTR